MDLGPKGLSDTIHSLDRAGLKHVGAGVNEAAALAPLQITVGGTSLAMLARSSVIIKSPCYATDDRSGVAWFDKEETLARIVECRRSADVVVLAIHWGIEAHRYPSPDQIGLAKAFAEAGADLILGHHSHVVQGLQRVHKALVVYSFGNFVFSNFRWRFLNDDGVSQTSDVVLLPEHRRGMVVRGDLYPRPVGRIDVVPSWIGEDNRLRPEVKDPMRGKSSFTSRFFASPFYGIFWRMYAARVEWVLRIQPRIFGDFHLRRIGRVRFRHLHRALRLVARSIRIITGRSTNPYE